jgi:hypothetical protein
MITFRVSLKAYNFEKHTTYRFSMELRQCNGNATDAVRRYGEKHRIAECRVVVLSLLLSADPESREDFMKCDETLAVHVLYVTFGLKSRLSRSLKRNLMSVPDVFWSCQESGQGLDEKRSQKTLGFHNWT